MVGGVHYKLVRESAYDGISDVSVDNSINPSNSKNRENVVLLTWREMSLGTQQKKEEKARLV